MQNLLNFISIAGFVISLGNVIYIYLSHSIRLTVEIKDYKKIAHVVILYLYIQNNSVSPIAISGISILQNDKEYPCKLRETPVIKTNDKVDLATPNLPVNLTGQQSHCFVFVFLNCKDIELDKDKKVELEIYTNRRRLRKCLSLHDTDTLFPHNIF